jgi:hypothetical protein
MAQAGQQTLLGAVLRLPNVSKDPRIAEDSSLRLIGSSNDSPKAACPDDSRSDVQSSQNASLKWTRILFVLWYITAPLLFIPEQDILQPTILKL